MSQSFVNIYDPAFAASIMKASGKNAQDCRGLETAINGFDEGALLHYALPSINVPDDAYAAFDAKYNLAKESGEHECSPRFLRCKGRSMHCVENEQSQVPLVVAGSRVELESCAGNTSDDRLIAALKEENARVKAELAGCKADLKRFAGAFDVLHRRVYPFLIAKSVAADKDDDLNLSANLRIFQTKLNLMKGLVEKHASEIEPEEETSGVV